MQKVEDMEAEAGWSRFDYIPMNYRSSSLPQNFIPVMIDLLFLFLIFGPMFKGGGMNNMMSKAMGIDAKNIEIVKKTGVCSIIHSFDQVLASNSLQNHLIYSQSHHLL